MLVPRKNWIKIQFSFFKYVLTVPNLTWFWFFFGYLNVLVGAKMIFLIPVSMKVDRGYNMVTPHCLSLCVLVWVVAGVGGSPSSSRRGKSVWTRQQSWEEALLPCWIFFTIIRKIIISKPIKIEPSRLMSFETQVTNILNI